MSLRIPWATIDRTIGQAAPARFAPRVWSRLVSFAGGIWFNRAVRQLRCASTASCSSRVGTWPSIATQPGASPMRPSPCAQRRVGTKPGPDKGRLRQHPASASADGAGTTTAPFPLYRLPAVPCTALSLYSSLAVPLFRFTPFCFFLFSRGRDCASWRRRSFSGLHRIRRYQKSDDGFQRQDFSLLPPRRGG